MDATFAIPGAPPGFGNRRRQALRDVFHGIVARTKTWPADALLIPGDLFEIERVTRDTIAFLKAEFESLSPIPIFIAPGNHDPFTRSSPYTCESWPEHVMIFEKPEWTSYSLDSISLTVHGFAFDGPDISRNPFGNLRVPSDGRVHIALAHGSEMGSLPPEKGAYAPFHAGQAAAEGLRYLALGHYHSRKTFETVSGTWMEYSGAPEGHGFGEPGLHYYLEVEIEGKETRVTAVPSSRSIYLTHSIDCSRVAGSHEIIEAIRALAGSVNPRQIARVRLTGVASAAWHQEIPAIRDVVAPEFEFLELVDELEPEEDYETLGRQQTSLGAFVRRMNKELQSTTNPDRRRLVCRARELGAAAYQNRALRLLELDEG